jgi:hypothetical protein
MPENMAQLEKKKLDGKLGYNGGWSTCW